MGRLRTIACCAVLELAAMLGAPMRPEQIADLMRALNEPTIARTDPEERHRGEGPPADGRADPPASAGRRRRAIRRTA